MNNCLCCLIIILLFIACNQPIKSGGLTETVPIISNTSIILLGTIQDAGSPHIACKKDCCKDLFTNPDPLRKVISLGLYDAFDNKKYLFEATPDISTQTKILHRSTKESKGELPDGIFVTHAHIGHYTGLMYLGKEATNANMTAVYTMPIMKNYLENNGPWSQLVENRNIDLIELKNGKTIELSDNLRVTPFKVPHRDEFSETVGYRIKGPNKSALFIPDIDKWEKWDSNIIEEIGKVDFAFLDATFFSGEEINNRDISQIPHPFIVESFKKFDSLPSTEKSKIHFIHFNHTNPVINENSDEAKLVKEKGYNLGKIYETFEL